MDMEDWCVNLVSWSQNFVQFEGWGGLVWKFSQLVSLSQNCVKFEGCGGVVICEGRPGDCLAVSGLHNTSGLQTQGNILSPVQLTTFLHRSHLADIWRIVNHRHLSLKRVFWINRKSNLYISNMSNGTLGPKA